MASSSGTTTTSVMALDVGERRVGVALASAAARIARPLTTLQNDDAFFANMQKLIAEHGVTSIVVGLPRGLDGQSTAQTAYVESFAKGLEARLGLPLHWQDEAVTSRQARDELEARAKPYAKADIDALAATYILEDFLNRHPEPREP
jgi:putative Holliday junction resolvase